MPVVALYPTLVVQGLVEDDFRQGRETDGECQEYPFRARNKG